MVNSIVCKEEFTCLAYKCVMLGDVDNLKPDSWNRTARMNVAIEG